MFHALTPKRQPEGLCPNRNPNQTTTQGQEGGSTMKRILDLYFPFCYFSNCHYTPRTLLAVTSTPSGANSTHQLSGLGSVAGHQRRRCCCEIYTYKNFVLHNIIPLFSALFKLHHLANCMYHRLEENEAKRSSLLPFGGDQI